MNKQQISLDEFLKLVNSELLPSNEWLDFLMASPPVQKMPERHAEKLSSALREAQQQRHRVAQKLSLPDKLTSLGEYLQLTREKLDIEKTELASKLKLEHTVLHKLETNDTAIISVSVEMLCSLGRNLELSTPTYIELLRKSHRLYKIKPKYRGAARYDSKSSKSAAAKGKSMKSAFEELLLKGKTEERDEALESHLEEVRKILEQI